MVFHSLEFAFFLPVVFTLYWLARSQRYLQNLIIVAASLFFYGWWDWRFLSLILFSSFLDFFTGILLGCTGSEVRRKLLLGISVSVNLGFLGYFKYYNFFIDTFVDAFTLFGFSISPERLNIVLPAGISFYTFQTMSYTIDVYRRQLEPTKDAVSFLAFVSFFPQLVAGPIERATNLLPQFQQNRTFSFEAGSEGLRQILWGLFKKIVIADNCAIIADKVFENYELVKGSYLYAGVLCFTIQIYCDFSAYSDIAIGTARLFGFRLMQNFANPYFSQDLGEFWQRWHISLTTWFRDYVYLPLGGSKVDRITHVRNVVIVFLLSGFWHGASWTFITWGALNAFFLVTRTLLKRKKIIAPNDVSRQNVIVSVIRTILTFHIVLVGSILFRSKTLPDALSFASRMFHHSLFSWPEWLFSMKDLFTGLFIIVLFAMEWWSRQKSFPLEKLQAHVSRPTRWSIYVLLSLAVILMNTPQQSSQFIYFQF